MTRNRISLAGRLLVLALVGWGAGCTSPAIGGEREGDSVTIYRDSFGVPHVYGNTPEALFYAGGYALMQDRMAEFERARRGALGRRAELEPSFVEADRRSRLVALSEAETRAMFEALEPEHQRMMQALVAGINRAIDEALADPDQRMPYEFGVLWEVEPEHWTLHDYIVTFAAHRQALMGRSLELQNLDFYRDLVDRYGEARARVIFDDVLPLDDPAAIAVNPSPGPFPQSLSGILPLASGSQASEGPVEPLAQVGFLGAGGGVARRPEPLLEVVAPMPVEVPTESRSLVVGPARSASGNVLMMQATSDGPHIRYVGAGFDAYGYTRQGGGPLVMGRGPNFGWLQNVGYDDQIDIFAERLNPDDQYQYWFRGEWREMERRTETIRVRGLPDETFEVLTTVHGPVVAWDLANDLAFAEQNALRGAELNDWVCNLEWARARTLAEFERSIPLCAATTTINYGGEDGTIAHWHAARRPVRPGGTDPRLPTPGTGEYEWQGWVPFSEWSKFMNPPEGFFHAWNARTTPSIPFRDAGRWGATSRNYLAYDLMKGRDKVSLEEFNDINRMLGSGWGGTDQSIVGPKFFVPYLRAAVAGDRALEEAVERMAGWNAILEDLDGDGFYDDPGLTLMLRWLDVARETIIGGVIGEWEPRSVLSYRTALLHRAVQGDDAPLPMRTDWFGGRDRDAVLRETMRRTVDELASEFGTADPSAWKQPIYWRYYDAAAMGEDPQRPSRRPTAHGDEFSGWRGTTAGRLGLIPSAVPDNGSERWNGIMEVSSREKIVFDASPSGGQNQFISLAGEATPNLADQLMRHVRYDLKRVPMERDELRAQAISVVSLPVPTFD